MNESLFTNALRPRPMEQISFFPRKNPWKQTKDADPDAKQIFNRHYSRRRYRDGRDPAKFIGPGEYILLVLPDYSAIFAWRKFISDDGQQGVNCAIFRNESKRLSSDLILYAEEYAVSKWPGERLYTYINPKKIMSENPGFCFQVAGWRRAGRTKGGLIILEKSIVKGGEPCLKSNGGSGFY